MEKTQMLSFDIMIGDRFYATYRARFPMKFDLESGTWTTDLGTEEDVRKLVLERYPSLEGKEFRIAF